MRRFGNSVPPQEDGTGLRNLFLKFLDGPHPMISDVGAKLAQVAAKRR
jgi:hypothetical protein